MNEKHIVFKILNMSCVACETRIEKALRKLIGVSLVKASYNNGEVKVSYNGDVVSIRVIRETIEGQGYKISTSTKEELYKPMGIMLIIATVVFVISKFEILNIMPRVDASVGYLALFVVGLITSLHCTAMCGGINISQCMTYKQNKKESKSALFPSVLYNAGRVTSYTVIGGIVGALGSVISFSGYAKGIIALIAGVFMVVMGLNMLGIFPWLKKFTPRMPKSIANKIGNKNNYGPYVVGLLNGLMPCGPLQTMQMYALGTGNALSGALSMLLFSLGTVPLMFGLGAVSSILKERFAEKILKFGAVLVIVLGVGMFNNGAALSGIALKTDRSIAKQTEAVKTENKYVNPATVNGDVQEITTQLGRSYTPITVQKGIPVKWTIKAEKGSINGCNNEIQIPKYNITHKLKLGDNIIEFTPTATGTVPYSCWMGMIRSSIKVVDDLGTN